MANELNIRLDPVDETGLSVSAIVRYPGGTQLGSTVAMTEPLAGYYTGTFSLAAVADGAYSVEFLDDDDGALLGEGVLEVKDNDEISLYRLNDLSSADIYTELFEYRVPTYVEMINGFNGLNDLSVGEATTACSIALDAYNGPTKIEMLASFSEIKGVGWTDQTLKNISDSLSSVGTDPSEVWAYADRQLTAGTKDAEIDDIKAKADQLDFTGTAGALKSESTNMRGTEEALLAADYVAPDNTRILEAHSALLGNSTFDEVTELLKVFYVDNPAVELVSFKIDRNANFITEAKTRQA